MIKDSSERKTKVDFSRYLVYLGRNRVEFITVGNCCSLIGRFWVDFRNIVLGKGATGDIG